MNRSHRALVELHAIEEYGIAEGFEQENRMSRFQSLDTVLAHDKNFREFFSALASGRSNPSSTSTRLEAAADVTDPPNNNLLRRLNRADLALIEPLLVRVQTLESRRRIDRTAIAPCAGSIAPTTISDDFDTAYTDTGPHWARNSTRIAGDLVTETNFAKSWTTQNSPTPNADTTTNWSWPNMPAGYNVCPMPSVFYGTYGGFTSPTQQQHQNADCEQ